MKRWVKRIAAAIIILLAASFFAQKLIGMPQTHADVLQAAILKPLDIGAGYRAGRYAHYNDLQQPTRSSRPTLDKTSCDK